jgi:purine-binding chemotaxis protein CheW
MSTTLHDPAVPVQVVTFESGEYHFGIDVLTVQEVLKHQEMTPVPLAPPEIYGLINLRGNIVTAIGIRERLRLQAEAARHEQMNLIVSLRDGAASLIVDRVGDVLTLDHARYRTRPSTLVSPLADVVTGVYELDDGLLLLLDAQALCTINGDKTDEH